MMDGWMDGWMSGSMPGWMDVWMDTDPDVSSRTRFWTYVDRVSTWVQWFEHHGCIKVAVQGIRARRNGFLADCGSNHSLAAVFWASKGAHGVDFSNMNEKTAAILMLEAVNLQKWMRILHPFWPPGGPDFWCHYEIACCPSFFNENPAAGNTTAKTAMQWMKPWICQMNENP